MLLRLWNGASVATAHRPSAATRQWRRLCFLVVSNAAASHYTCEQRDWAACTSRLIKSGICAQTARMPDGIERSQTCDALRPKPRFHVAPQAAGQMTELGERGLWFSLQCRSCNFQTCLICQVAITPHRTLRYKATGCAPSETSKDKAFKKKESATMTFIWANPWPQRVQLDCSVTKGYCWFSSSAAYFKGDKACLIYLARL